VAGERASSSLRRTTVRNCAPTCRRASSHWHRYSWGGPRQCPCPPQE